MELAWPEEIPPLALPVISDLYIIPNRQQPSCFVGATFERNFSNLHPESSVAEAYLRPRAAALVPALKEAKLLSCKAGIRAMTQTHLPIVTQLNAKTWVLTGLGSKGLLYHAYLACQLAKRMSV